MMVINGHGIRADMFAVKSISIILLSVSPEDTATVVKH